MRSYMVLKGMGFIYMRKKILASYCWFVLSFIGGCGEGLNKGVVPTQPPFALAMHLYNHVKNFNNRLFFFTYFTRVILINNLETLIFPPAVIKIACYKKGTNCIQNVQHKQYRHIHVHVDITPVPDRGFVLCAILGQCVCCVIFTFQCTNLSPPFGVLGSKICFLHYILFS